MLSNKTPEEMAHEICQVQPIEHSIMAALFAAEKAEPLPKHWEPKNEYVEVSRGVGIDYQERIILKSDVRAEIMAGWSITRLSKISPRMVIHKWLNAIIAMEK